ncbi:MAG: hypothetical protein WD960_15135 [Gemmatimonadota bacterium]
MKSNRRPLGSGVLTFLALALVIGCQPGQEEHPPPAAEEVEPHFTFAGGVSIEISGNVARVTVPFDPEEYARGGDLWAKAMPYIFLFSPGSRDAFEAHPGLAGIRVLSQHPNGDIIAEALLSRGNLNQLTWQRAINIAGAARQEGTDRPGTMQTLVEWGEDHTDFEYNPDYIGSA